MRPSAEAMLKLSHMLASAAFRWNDDTTPDQVVAVEALEDMQYAQTQLARCFLEMNEQSAAIYRTARELKRETPFNETSDVVVDLDRYRKPKPPADIE